MQVTQENFEQVLTSSMQKPLFCFFYVEQPECQTAKNALTTAISDDNEFVTLALCDLKDQVVQYLAAQLGLANAPALVVIDKGQPAAILEGGNEIVSKLQELLNQFMPSQSELRLQVISAPLALKQPKPTAPMKRTYSLSSSMHVC